MPTLTKRMKVMAEKLPKTEAPMLDRRSRGDPQAIQQHESSTSRSNIAMRLGIDAKQADQLVRGSIVLPHGIGKSLRVIVFAKGDMAEASQGRRRRRSRRRRAGQENQGRLDRFRRLHRGARHDGHRRPLGQSARPARADAFAPRRHGHARRGQDGQANTRPAKWSSATTPAASSTAWSAS